MLSLAQASRDCAQILQSSPISEVMKYHTAAGQRNTHIRLCSVRMGLTDTPRTSAWSVLSHVTLRQALHCTLPSDVLAPELASEQCFGSSRAQVHCHVHGDECAGYALRAAASCSSHIGGVAAERRPAALEAVGNTSVCTKACKVAASSRTYSISNMARCQRQHGTLLSFAPSGFSGFLYTGHQVCMLQST